MPSCGKKATKSFTDDQSNGREKVIPGQERAIRLLPG